MSFHHTRVWTVLYVDDRVEVGGGNGVYVGEDHVFGSVVSVFFYVIVTHDWEGVQDMGCCVAVQAIEVKEQGVQARDQVAAVLEVPGKRVARKTHGLGKGPHVPGHVGQFQDLC